MRTDGPVLTAEEQALLAGEGGAGVARALRVVVAAARFLDAPRLVAVSSAHVDGCLYHGDGGVEYAERLVREGARVRVPTTLNVGALDLLHPERVRADPHATRMSARLMEAHVTLGCTPTWTCAPYQAGHRPAVGSQVAWGESNAVAFVNSVLGARTNRYGDFLDVACAISGRAPWSGLHTDEGRLATLLVELGHLPADLRAADVFYPVLGSWLGRHAGGRVAALDGLPLPVSEDRLKALGAAAASTGAVGLFHVIGATPEAPDVATAFGGRAPTAVLRPSRSELARTLSTLSSTERTRLDAVAVGSPHFSLDEFSDLEALLPERPFAVPFYVCTGRGVLERLETEGRLRRFEDAGIRLVADTCVVVAPILDAAGGTLMTNSGKFAHYTPGTTGYDVVFGSLEECVRSAREGRVRRDAALWGAAE
ncbi:MAG: aconitase X catalytic domain-containing protein [Gemmatimonadota bacterium]|nr:aconitase X catalytic domain-containing protein [Gemmatimonadota bacterium]